MAPVLRTRKTPGQVCAVVVCSAMWCHVCAAQRVVAVVHARPLVTGRLVVLHQATPLGISSSSSLSLSKSAAILQLRAAAAPSEADHPLAASLSAQALAKAQVRIVGDTPLT